LVRVFKELVVEVIDVAVRVALAEDRDEAEDVALKAETRAVSCNQTLTGQFRRAVKTRLDREGTDFRRREDLRFAVDRSRRGEGDATHPVGSHRFEDMEGGDRVLLKILARVLGAEADVGVRGEVEDEVVPGDVTGQGGQVEQVALDEAESRMAQRISKELALA